MNRMADDATTRVAIVTGAASGIGKAVAAEFAAAGYGVFLVDRDEARLQETLKGRFAERPVGIHVGDVSRPADVDAALSACLSRFGRVDALVANAGLLPKESFLEMGEEQWDRVLGVNLKGVFLWGQAVARWMVSEKQSGRIINIACMRAELVTTGMAAYAASKGGVKSLTRAMAVELAPYGITVNAIAPGRTLTEGLAPLLTDPERVKKVEALIPLGRLAQPEEIAHTALFLASERAAYLTGAVIPVDGGYTCFKP